MGFSAISYSEMKAYFDLYSINPESWEIEVIKLFDNIAYEFAKKYQKEQDAEQSRKRSRVKSK